MEINFFNGSTDSMEVGMEDGAAEHTQTRSEERH